MAFTRVRFLRRTDERRGKRFVKYPKMRQWVGAGPQALVLNDSRLVHPLLFIEYAVGKQMTFPSHFERPI